MQFHSWQPDYDLFRKTVDHSIGLHEFTRKRVEEFKRWDLPPWRVIVEHIWITTGRPYYNVHPKLVSKLARVNLHKIPAHLIQLPHEYPVVSIQLAEPSDDLTLEESIPMDFSPFAKLPPMPKGASIKAILLCDIRAVKSDYPAKDSPAVMLILDFGIYQEGQPSYVIFAIPVDQGLTLQDAIDGVTKDNRRPSTYHEVCSNALRLATTIGFLANSKSDLIEYDVLSKFRDEFRAANNTRREHIIRKSRQRGKIGWNVGNDLMFLGALPRQKRSDSQETGRELEYAHIREGHAHAVRYGTGHNLVKIMWFVPTVVRPDRPFKIEE